MHCTETKGHSHKHIKYQLPQQVIKITWFTLAHKKKIHHPAKQVDTYQCNCIYIKITSPSALTNYLQVASYK